MNDDAHRLRREQRETTDRFISAVRNGLARLDALSTEVNRTRDLDAEIRAALPRGEMGDTLREWLDGHDDIADELQATCEALAEVLREGAGYAASTEIYLHQLEPQSEDPRGDG